MPLALGDGTIPLETPRGLAGPCQWLDRSGRSDNQRIYGAPIFGKLWRWAFVMSITLILYVEDTTVEQVVSWLQRHTEDLRGRELVSEPYHLRLLPASRVNPAIHQGPGVAVDLDVDAYVLEEDRSEEEVGYSIQSLTNPFFPNAGIRFDLLQIGPRTEIQATCRWDNPAIEHYFAELIADIARAWPEVVEQLQPRATAEEELEDKPTAEERADRQPWDVIPEAQSRRIVELWTAGESGPEIGLKLGYTAKTIQNRISDLRKMFGCRVVPYHRQSVLEN